MVKNVKKAMVIILIVITSLIIGLLLYIFVGENEYTKMDKQEVEKVTNTIIEEINTELNSSDISGEEKIDGEVKDDGDTEKEESDNNSAKVKIKAGQGGLANIAGTEVSQEEKKLLSIYDVAFYNLQSSANDIVNGLVSGIKNDYSILVGRNEASPDKLMKLGASYTKRANALEGQVDSSVGAVLDKMETDMSDRGISKDKIKAYRKAYEDEYKRQKEARRNSIMSKAQEMM